MPKPIADGSHYIQENNQDYWLRLDGVWVRMGNIRDEGTGGLVSVPPIISHGFDMEVAHLDRIKYVPDEAGFIDSFGFDQAVAVTLTRYVPASMMSVGFSMDATVSRIRPIVVDLQVGYTQTSAFALVANLTYSGDMGFNMVSPVDKIQSIVAAMSVGYDQAGGPNTVASLVANMSYGFTTTTGLVRDILLSATMGLGYSMSATLTGSANPAPTMNVGFSMAATLTRAVQLAPSFAYGFNTSTALTPIALLNVSMGLGFSQASPIASYLLPGTVNVGYGMAVTLNPYANMGATFAEGYSMAAAVTRSIQLTASMAYGFSQLTVLTHQAAQPTTRPSRDTANAGAVAFTTATGVTGSITRTSGEYALAIIATGSTSGTAQTVSSVSGLGVTWTKLASGATAVGGTRWQNVEIWGGFCASSGSGTVTVNLAGTPEAAYAHVTLYNNVNTTNPHSDTPTVTINNTAVGSTPAWTQSCSFNNSLCFWGFVGTITGHGSWTFTPGGTGGFVSLGEVQTGSMALCTGRFIANADSPSLGLSSNAGAEAQWVFISLDLKGT